MRIARIKVALFALFLAAPVAALLLFGSADSYGRPQTRFPSVGKVLLGKQGRFDQFGDAVLERSDVRRLAIQLRNWISYRVVGFVDSDIVVSGNGDWLFYRAEFNGGRCLDEAPVAEALRGFAALVDMARAAGIEMIVSLSPDKSTIYPDALSTTMRGYWRCRIGNIAAVRRIIGRELPGVVDHAGPLLAERARNPDAPLYYATDTHWTPYGSAIALRQLLAAVYPEARISPPRIIGAPQPKTTDLSRLLLLPMEESADGVEPPRPQDLGSPAGGPPLRTLILHDSFYASLRQQLPSLLSPATMRTFDDKNVLRADAMAADRIIVNMVERTLLLRLTKNLAWDTALGRAIVARSQRRAKGCESFRAWATTGTPAGASEVIAVRGLDAGRLPCLRLSFSATRRAVLHLALPRSDSGAFETGRALTHTLAPGDHTVAFVLPAYAAGRSIRFSVDDAAVTAIEVGEIAASAGLAAEP